MSLVLNKGHVCFYLLTSSCSNGFESLFYCPTLNQRWVLDLDSQVQQDRWTVSSGVLISVPPDWDAARRWHLVGLSLFLFSSFCFWAEFYFWSVNVIFMTSVKVFICAFNCLLLSEGNKSVFKPHGVCFFYMWMSAFIYFWRFYLFLAQEKATKKRKSNFICF